jgi:hypothetical protein
MEAVPCQQGAKQPSSRRLMFTAGESCLASGVYIDR